MELVDGWELTATPPGDCAEPHDTAKLRWQPAHVPGTAAGAIGNDGRDFDAEDWWFRTRFDHPAISSHERLVLELDGIATVSQVFLNGELIHEAQSMWASAAIDLEGRLLKSNELMIACRALSPLLELSRRPRQRWRTRTTSDGNLRWYRTMILGRSPGYAPGPAAVGPWRPVRITRAGPCRRRALEIRTAMDGEDAIVRVDISVEGGSTRGEISIGNEIGQMRHEGSRLHGEVRLPRVERWWPHTHGQATLHDLHVSVDDERVASRRVGFRSLSWAEDILADGLDLHVNSTPVFCRGAIWTPPDLVSMAPGHTELRGLLERACDAGMNMLRVIGTGAYESPLFYDLCDELGILVWQDFMFASLDYPLSEPGFRAQAESEVRQVLQELAWRPSLAVLCGNHEVEQQPAMLGLDPDLGRDAFWEEVLPKLVKDGGASCAYVRSTPCGGELPFRPDRGIAHYFAVGGFFRSFEEVRRSEVRFAAECLAHANVPDEAEVPVHHPAWKEGVQRDAGPAWQPAPGWDFDDVRDVYFKELFKLEPSELRRIDHPRYLELSRMATAELMTEVLGEWRREASPCRGALVIWFKDTFPGAGFGLLDHRGLPKVAFHHVRRLFSPLAIWTTDEGLNGVAIHAVNDRREALRARLRVTLYADLETRVAEAEEKLELPPHGAGTRTVEGMLGRFVDAANAYAFGPPAHDVIVATLSSEENPQEQLAQSMRFPAGRPLLRESASNLGLECAIGPSAQDGCSVVVHARRLAYGVRLQIPGHWLSDNSFSVEPGAARVIEVKPLEDWGAPLRGTLTAINMHGDIRIG